MMPVTRDGGSEFARLRKTVLSGGGVEDEQNIVRRAGNDFGGGALHFFELGHQIGFGVQASGGIDDDDVGGARLGSGHRVVNDRGGIGAGFLFDDFDAVALRPDFQLLDGGGAKGVRGAEHHAAAFLAKAVGELADAGGLARAVDADNENHARAAAILRSGDAAGCRHIRPDRRVQDSNDVRLDLALELRGIGERVAVHLFAHGIEDFARRLHAQVGGEQRGLQILEDRRIDLALAEKNRVNGLGKRRLGLADGLLQPLEECRLRLILAKK